MRAIIEFEATSPVQGVCRVTNITWDETGHISIIISTRYIEAENTVSDNAVFTPIDNSNERFEHIQNNLITCKLIWLPN